MKNEKKVLIYIFGILSGMIIIPCIEGLSSVFLLWIEWLKILPSKLIAKGNKEISESYSINSEDCCSNAIGFQIPDTDDDIYYDE